MSNFQNINFSRGLRDDDLLCAGKSEANYPRLLGSHQVSLIQETVNLQKRRLLNKTARTIGRQITVPISVTVDSADDFSEYTDNTFKSIDGFVQQSIPTQKSLIHNRDKNNYKHGMSKLFHPLNSYTKTPEQISEKNNGQLSYEHPCTETFTYHYLDDLNNTFLNLNFPDKTKNFVTSHTLSDNDSSILDKKHIHKSLNLSSNTRIMKECNTQYMETQDDFEDELFSYHGLTNTTTTTTTTTTTASVNATAYTDQETNSIDYFTYSSPHVSKTSSQSSHVNPHTIKDLSILCTEKSKSIKKNMITTLNQLQDSDFLLHSFDMDMDMDTNILEPVCSGRVHPSDKMFAIQQDLSHHHLCDIRRVQDIIPQDHIQYNHTKSTTARDVLDVNKDIIPPYMYSDDNMTSFMSEKYNNIHMNQNARAPIYYSMTSQNLSKWNEVVQMNNNKQQDDYKQDISKSLNTMSSTPLIECVHTRSHFCPIYQPLLPTCILTDTNDVNTNPNSNSSTNSNTTNHTSFHHAMVKTIHHWPYSTYLAEGFDMK